MFRINLLITFLFVAFAVQLNYAQKYIDEVFSEVEVIYDMTYGVNATVIAFQQAGEAIPQQLKMDIYQPVGDTAPERPLALVFHTGNFLPPVLNGQIAGSKQDSSVVEICTRLAKMGYTAASVTYRQGWNPLAQTQPERALGLIQAAYRGIQDARTSVRFFKENYENNNAFKIDPNRIVAIGAGTGGYITLGMATLDDYNEIVDTEFPAGKFLLDLLDTTVDPPVPGQDGTPETPMVVPVYHGDIEGKEFGVAPDAAFGFPAGDTLCYANHVNQNSEIQLVMNIGGALGDLSWLDNNSTPIISVQSAYDQFAPYIDDVLVVPTTEDDIVQVQGSFEVAKKQDLLGKNGTWVNAMVIDSYTAEAQANSATANHDFYEALFPITNPANSIGQDEGVVINWWDPNAAAPNVGQGDGIPWNQLPYPLDGTGEPGDTYHTQGLLLNENMSAAKARANIDKIIGFYAPRAYCQLKLGELDPNGDPGHCGLVSTENIEAAEVALSIAPNPADNEIVLTAQGDSPIRSVRIFDITGRSVREYHSIDNNNFKVNRGNMQPGAYIMMVGFDEGDVSQKLILK